ncbi:MAG: DUF4012 domain-containing protein [Nocardioidaceae bacterium]|nr:DUF4012 domain-containing protein [Nocardioidaceae bacterium]
MGDSTSDRRFSGPTPRQLGIAAAVVVLVAVGLFVWQAVTAARALTDARERADQVQDLVRAGDFDGAGKALTDLRAKTRSAHDATDGLLWDIGRHVPFAGRTIGAVQTVSAVLDTATRDNAPVALRLSQAVKTGEFRPKGGQIDVGLVRQLTPDVRRAAGSIAKAGADLDEIEANGLTFPFNDLVGDLQEQVESARTAATAASTAFELLPNLLGEGTPRNYLLIVQNPAELRSTGGLPGSLAVLHAENGRVTMGWQGSATDVNRGLSGPVVRLPKDTAQQYGPTVASDLRDANFTPDFPEAAQIAALMVERTQHVKLDGVVSVDPLALAAMMQGTGPIGVGNGITLAPTNVVAALLNQTYQALDDPVAQDDFFERVAQRIFDTVMSGQGSQELAVKGLAAGVEQHRVLLWLRDPQLQARLTDSAIAGDLAAEEDPRPHVGMYLNDSTAAKMDYYLQYRSAVSAVDCRNDGAQDLRASVVLTSTAPKDVSGLSVWVTGDGSYAPKGTIAFNLRLYGPYGGEITGLTVDGKSHSITADQHQGRQVALLPLALKPGQQVTVTADLRTGPDQRGDGVFDFTPGILPAPNGVKITSACR